MAGSAPEPPPAQPEAPQDKAADFEAMRESLAAGVQVVSAPQLFPTPRDLAARLVKLAEIGPAHRVLEPSAGTGVLISMMVRGGLIEFGGKIVAVEINFALAEGLRRQRDKTLWANERNFDVRCCDFLACNGTLGLFDRIVMNPPFVNGEDIKHIEHARNLLKPGGRLVAICANGPRQRDRLMSQALEWIDLEPGTFAESGTNVNAAIVIFAGAEGGAA